MLELDYVSKVVGLKTVLNNINLKIADGQAVAVCGDKDSASWMFQAIPRLLKLKRGDISSDGEDTEGQVGDFSYMGVQGSFLWEKSIRYSVNFRKKWYSGYNEDQREQCLYQLKAGVEDKALFRKLNRREQAIQVLALGMSLGCRYWLMDQMLPELTPDQRAVVYTMITEHCRKRGTVMASIEEDMLCKEAQSCFDRLIYMKSGYVLADVDLHAPSEKSLEIRMKEWAKEGV